MQVDFSALRAWRPSARELWLFKILLGILIAGWVWSSYSSIQSAVQNETAAQERLAEARRQFSRLSDTKMLAAQERQSNQLLTLTMDDPTPQLSQLRMREELTDLATRSGLSNVTIEDVVAPIDGQSTPRREPEFVALSMSLEADFDWSAFARLIRELEGFYRGYLIDGVEARSDGQVRRIRLTMRILHQKVGGGE